jgi:hypothetical protein
MAFFNFLRSRSANGGQQALQDRTLAQANREAGFAAEQPIDTTLTVPDEATAKAFIKQGSSITFGVSGTPITSGFLSDLGEYKRELMGRNAILEYEKMRRGNAIVRMVLQSCKLPVLSARWDIVPPINQNDPSYKDAKEIADQCKANLLGGLEYHTENGAFVSQPWQSVIRNALLMLDFGCAVHEEVWTVDGDMIRLRNLPARLPVTFYRWLTDDDGESLIALEQYGYRKDRFLNVTLPSEKMARFTYEQEGANFWGIALLRSMYPSWYMLNALQRIDGIACERNGLGIPVWKLQPGHSEDDRASAFTTVNQLIASEATGIVEPPGDANTGFRLVGTTGSVRQIIPSMQFHSVQMAMAALAMFTQSGQMPHGSRMATGVHEDFFLLALQSLADQIGQTITTTTLRRWAQLNYGMDAPVPRCIAANVESRRLEDIADALTKFAGVGLIKSEDNVRNYIRDELALPVESDEGVIAPRATTISPEAAQQEQIIGPGAGKQTMTELYATLPDTPKTLALRPGSAFKSDRPIMFVSQRPTGSGRALRLRIPGHVRLGEARTAGVFVVTQQSDDGDLIVTQA